MRVDGGQFFIGGDIMEVIMGKEGRVLMAFTDEERSFIEREAKENNVTETELIELLFGMMFIAGYKTLTGKESTNELEG